MSTFSERLKISRKNRNKTQRDVANYLGISERGYQNYEIAKREPNNETLVKLADFFNVSVDYLLGRKNYNINEQDQITVTIPPDILNWNREEMLALNRKHTEGGETVTNK